MDIIEKPEEEKDSVTDNLKEEEEKTELSEVESIREDKTSVVTNYFGSLNQAGSKEEVPEEEAEQTRTAASSDEKEGEEDLDKTGTQVTLTKTTILIDPNQDKETITQ